MCPGMFPALPSLHRTRSMLNGTKGEGDCYRSRCLPKVCHLAGSHTHAGQGDLHYNFLEDSYAA